MAVFLADSSINLFRIIIERIDGRGRYWTKKIKETGRRKGREEKRREGMEMKEMYGKGWGRERKE